MTGTVIVVGLEDVKKILTEIAPKHARNLMRATVHGVAAEIAKRAKQNAPVDSGDLKKSIKARRRKSHPDNPTSEVYVQTGLGKKPDAFYWRFVEYGTGGGAGSHEAKQYQSNAQPFISPAIDHVRANMHAIMRDQFGKKLEKMIAREAKKNK